MLFTADPWEVDVTLVAQQCCRAVLQRGFLGRKEKERIEDASGAGHVLNSYTGRKITESSCIFACKDPWDAS